MIKQNPSIGRMIAMAGFTLSVFAILIFLWLAFGGTVPLKPEGYRFTVHMPEAATLAEEADVRMAGVNVGKVKSKELDEGGARTIVEVQLDDAYAPIPKDTHAILRQKTLLGETYLELTPGNRSAGMLNDGERLANAQVEDTTELDEIFSAFDPQTRQAFRDWVKELDGAITKGHRSEDLNDAFGNFEGFAVDGAKLMQVLDEQDQAVHDLVKNTGQVFGAINERRGALRELILNSKRTFEATASRDKALAQTFAIFPTFLDESKATMARLEDFSHNTHPLVNDLKGPADDLGPTVRDLGDLAPDLEKLFRDLGPLIRVSRTGVPALGRTLHEAQPLADAAPHVLPGAQPDPVLLQLPPDDDRRVHHERRRGPRGRLRHGAARPDADRDHRGPLVRGLQVRQRPAGLGARQRVHASELADAGAAPRHDRELQVPEGRGEAARRRGQAG